ncbi:MAG: hypothetical protein ACLR9T_09795 [Thomasclavelia sp.]|uniref:hypothetical protein n=1 Tax=Thomasclavelia sp. TaxID=3025757 RepID=UPI0039A24507
MKKLTIIFDVLNFFALLFILVSRMNDSEMWFKITMGIISLASFFKLIYNIKK